MNVSRRKITRVVSLNTSEKSGARIPESKGPGVWAIDLPCRPGRTSVGPLSRRTRRAWRPCTHTTDPRPAGSTTWTWSAAPPSISPRSGTPYTWPVQFLQRSAGRWPARPPCRVGRSRTHGAIWKKGHSFGHLPMHLQWFPMSLRRKDKCDSKYRLFCVIKKCEKNPFYNRRESMTVPKE